MQEEDEAEAGVEEVGEAEETDELELETESEVDANEARDFRCRRVVGSPRGHRGVEASLDGSDGSQTGSEDASANRGFEATSSS